MKQYMAYQMVATAVTLNDLEGHSPVADVFTCNPSNICVTFYTISTDSVVACFLCISRGSCQQLSQKTAIIFQLTQRVARFLYSSRASCLTLQLRGCSDTPSTPPPSTPLCIQYIQGRTQGWCTCLQPVGLIDFCKQDKSQKLGLLHRPYENFTAHSPAILEIINFWCRPLSRRPTFSHLIKNGLSENETQSSARS